MKPFFTFFGGKWRAAPRYPRPIDSRFIIEPFAGSAGYSVRHYTKQVILIEKDPTIVALWRYLIAARAKDILALPVEINSTVRDLDICSAAQSLIGFWCNKGSVSPRQSPSAWMRSNIRPHSYWGPTIRARIAAQVAHIKHWTILEGDYRLAPDLDATWFIDPPYQNAGKLYRHSASEIDFNDLGQWCQARSGLTIVCENAGADWLPFEFFKNIKSTPGSRGKSHSAEAIWVQHPPTGYALGTAIT